MRDCSLCRVGVRNTNQAQFDVFFQGAEHKNMLDEAKYKSFEYSWRMTGVWWYEQVAVDGFDVQGGEQSGLFDPNIHVQEHSFVASLKKVHDTPQLFMAD